MGNYKKLALVLFSSAAISACSTINEGIRKIEGTPPDTSISAQSVYDEAKIQYNTWLAKLESSESLKLYSPSLYQDTMQAWSKAVDIYEDFAEDPAVAVKSYSFFSSGTYAERFQAEIAKVDAQYDKLLKLKARADEVLSPSIEQMAYLEEINSEKYYPERFKEMKSMYKSLFAYIADKELADAQNKQAEFLNQAKKLEIETVLEANIKPLEEDFNLLKSQQINEQAPISYLKAKAELALATQTVKSNPRNSQLISEAVKKVKFELAHTTNVAAEVRNLKITKPNELESLVLDLEGQLLSISKVFDKADFRDTPLRKQFQQVAQRANNLSQSHEAILQEVLDLKRHIELLKIQLKTAQAQIEAQRASQTEPAKENKEVNEPKPTT
ncbi:hypothetical protein SAMN02745127_02472 [Oceanospirillum multiglobuliferum]|uniref:Uncharacterized protein n=1 Tax=Oceanospirillum multiglobuliferum TaxID=64969 RepID=A0A1T4RMI7_9GAMM|nr:hypothetical protein [Oceanospirillum multiglobuliferum]OPX54761.1 hypothetical protein BTE48_12720 [Oceanospirillum multiglobuliferum]SKA17182.1 hypothetical protein SAMN02745127_02472 [Oceanospirillum multiglobuliferum]